MPDAGTGPAPPLVAVSNRLPVERGRAGWRPTAGGLVSALRPALEARGGAWVGWDGGVSGLPRRVEAAGRFAVFAVYCRNDLALSQSTAWTPATGPEDPRVGRLFSQLFLVIFTDAPLLSRPRFPAFPRF